MPVAAECPQPQRIPAPEPVQEAGLVLSEGPNPCRGARQPHAASRVPQASGAASLPPQNPLLTTGTCGGGLPAAASLGLTLGDCFLCVFWLIR